MLLQSQIFITLPIEGGFYMGKIFTKIGWKLLLESIFFEIGGDCPHCADKGIVNFDITYTGLCSDEEGLFLLVRCNRCGNDVETGDGDYFN